MRKVAIFGIAIIAAMAFTVAPVFACGADKETSTAATTSEASAQMVSAHGACPHGDKQACMAKLGISKEECEALCKELGGKCEFTSISVQGMTCGGCEEGVKTALMKAPGVMQVVRVSYKDGLAVVAVDKDKFVGTTATKLITDKGYKAEIIPAVAVENAAPAQMTTDGKMGCCSKTCTAKEKAACAAKEKDHAKETKSEAGGTD